MVRVLAWMARRLVRGFYRVETSGAPLVDSGPTLLVGNHSNGLVDPGLFIALSRTPVRFLAKFTLFEMPLVGLVVRWLRAIPIYRQKDGVGTERNERSFDAALDALAEGGVLGLFPEGTSHSGTRLLRPFRTGAARIALGAEARAGFELGLRIQPVGLVYDDRGRFRSRVTVHAGEPFTVEDLRALHERDRWAAVLELTRRIERALGAVVLEVDDERDRARALVAARLLLPAERRGVEARRRWVAGLSELRRGDPAAAREVEALLDRRARTVRRPGLGRLLPIARGAPGALLYLVPVLLAKLAVRCVPLDRDKDVTVLLVASWILFPAWTVAVAAAAVVASGGTLNGRGLGAALLALAASIGLGYATLARWPAPAGPEPDLAPGERELLSRCLAVREPEGRSSV